MEGATFAAVLWHASGAQTIGESRKRRSEVRCASTKHAARFFDGSNDARADLLRERFPRVLRPLVMLPRVVDGSPPFE